MANQIADSFTILSWNVRALNSKFKRALLFQYLKSSSSQLILLQETHLIGSKILTLKKNGYKRLYMPPTPQMQEVLQFSYTKTFHV